MPRTILLNDVLLLLCCSIYLGTGFSLVFFQFPVEPSLMPDNYAMMFVLPVDLATRFFTWMTSFMLLFAVVMLATEWFSGLRWVPVVVLLATITATLVTIWLIFPLNHELSAGIVDPERLKVVFHRWANLNRVRVGLWAVQWAAMAYFFYTLARRSRADR